MGVFEMSNFEKGTKMICEIGLCAQHLTEPLV